MSCATALNNYSGGWRNLSASLQVPPCTRPLMMGFCQCFYEVSFDDLHFEAIPIVAPKIKAIEKNQTNI